MRLALGRKPRTWAALASCRLERRHARPRLLQWADAQQERDRARCKPGSLTPHLQRGELSARAEALTVVAGARALARQPPCRDFGGFTRRRAMKGTILFVGAAAMGFVPASATAAPAPHNSPSAKSQ